MKNAKNILVIISLLSITAVSAAFMSCHEPAEITISGIARVGDTIVASSSGHGFSNNHYYEWTVFASADGVSSRDWGPGSGDDRGSYYTISPNYYSWSPSEFVQARRWNEYYGGYYYSNTIGPVMPAP